MQLLNRVRVVVYRFHEKGLEIFLINSDLENDPDIWNIPSGSDFDKRSLENDNLIVLDKMTENGGDTVETFAIEGDWHDIPSIRGMMKHDVKLAKKMVDYILPSMKNGTFVGIKEAFKKVLPQEYAALKEIKEIITDRNLLKNI